MTPEEERKERIRKSLEALNAPSGIELTKEQWIEVAESPEYEEED